MNADSTPDQTCMKFEPTSEHDWLKRLLGEWTYEHRCITEPGSEPQSFVGRETVHAIGKLWIQGHARGEMPGGSVGTMCLTIGFDPARGRFVGTWVGSMMTHLWVYEGWLEGDDTLVLEAVGPRFDDPSRSTKYRDITEFKGADERAFSAQMLQEDGSWTQMMTATYRRATEPDPGQ